MTRFQSWTLGGRALWRRFVIWDDLIDMPRSEPKQEHGQSAVTTTEFLLENRRNLSAGKPAKLALLEFAYAVPRCTQQTLRIPHKLKTKGASGKFDRLDETVRK